MSYDIEQELIKSVSEYLDIEYLSSDSDLFDICIHDYMEFAGIIILIEEAFEVDLENYDIEDIKTIKQISRIIQNKNEA